ncbi:MAG: cytochrome C [Desulfuromonadaceae bacterium]|nr:cytochrome C [Desulfuromonadaceae bacterium]
MKDSSGKYIDYSADPSKMLMGDSSFSTVAGLNPLLTKVDYSAWDLSQVCGSCHVGGGFVEKDRTGKRFSMMNPMVDGINPYTMTVFERYDPMTGMPAHTLEPAPWSYPIWNGTTPLTATGGWGKAMTMTMPDGSLMPIVDKQVMMPNVKEMDCLMCHFDGYNNLMSSVMAYSGAHNATPSFGAGFMNMFTQAYDFTTGLLNKDPATGVVSLSSLGMSKMKYDPPSQNCRNCHMPSNLKDLPDMMRDFLSSAPMIYTGNFTQSFTGLAMPSFDFNAPMTMDGVNAFTWDWKGPYAASPTLYMTMTGIGSSSPVSQPTIPAGWPAAMGKTEYNQAAIAALPPEMQPYFLGGGNPAGTGPIYYQATLADGMHQDQNILKKSVVPFPRAEWFKRGDLWAPGYDVHLALECSGCHMNTNTTKVDTFDEAGNIIFDGKSTCDPGRGFDSAGGVEATPSRVTTVNSQNTVKKCDNCHVTGKNNDGVVIDTFGAPNPLLAHQASGLTASVTKAVRLNATTGAEENFVGNHLDVMDCTVCHIARDQMVVRLLDCTSGQRYPNMLGFKKERGMMGMFSDPMGMGAPVGDNMEPWTPIYAWQKNGSDVKTLNGVVNADWRRKVYAINMITAAIWNNVDGAVDANGDGVPGRAPSNHGGVEVSPTINYDPWISRDMKAGLNFGPSGFAPIPVGFGADMSADGKASAYAPDGTFTGQWKYVGVYGGNIMFSTPEEISGYKAWREQISPAVDGKSWDGTQLSFVAGPYKLTHGIRPVDKFVLGKSCTDCHAPEGSSKVTMFDGTVNMVGTAIKATAGHAFMQSPAELMEIVGAKEDIETGAELTSKAGGLTEVKFEELGDWASGTFTANPAGNFKHVTEMDRNEALYPNVTGVNYVDVKGVNHTDRTGWKAYLTSITAEQFGIGVMPIASITSVFTDIDTATPGVQIAQGAAQSLAAADAQAGNVGFSSYAWTSSDATAIADGQTSNVTFTSTGLKTITLKVTDEEGNVAFTTQQVSVVVPPAADQITWVDNAGNLGGIVTVTSLPTPNDKLKIVWGDGKYDYVTTVNAASVSKAHTYTSAGSKLVQVYVYKANVQIGLIKQTIAVNGTN